MAYINPRVLDLGLNVLDTEATILHICSSEPANFAGIAAVSLGTKSAISVGAPADDGTGRKVTVAAVTDGTTASSGTATHWALADATNSRLLASNSLAAAKAVAAGSPWTTGAFDITLAGV